MSIGSVVSGGATKSASFATNVISRPIGLIIIGGILLGASILIWAVPMVGVLCCFLSPGVIFLGSMVFFAVGLFVMPLPDLIKLIGAVILLAIGAIVYSFGGVF